MDPLRELGRLLVIFGLLLVVAGGLLWLGGRLPLRLGRLPGDIVYRGRHSVFYFPLATSLLLSAALTLLLWILSSLRR
jgi:hypothetical protein